MSDQASVKAVATAQAVTAAVERPLRGGRPIARIIYNDDSRTAVRRLYNEMDRLPVFQLTPRGPLYAFESRLLKHLEMLSSAKEQEIAEAAMRAAAAPPAAQLKPPKRARAQARKVAVRRRERRSEPVG
jgi:hypothetical protein